MEEGDVPAEELPVDGDDGTSNPYNTEHDLEEECLVIGISCYAQYCSEYQTEKEGAPEIPIANFFTFCIGIHLG